MKCPKCGSENIAIERASRRYGISESEIDKAMKEIHSGKIFGYHCFDCKHNWR